MSQPAPEVIRNAPEPVLRPAFARWVWERKLELKEVGAAVGCSAENVRRIIMPFSERRRRVPGPALMARIIDYTNGEITPADFYAPTCPVLADRQDAAA